MTSEELSKPLGRRNRTVGEWFLLIFLSVWWTGVLIFLIHFSNFLIHAQHSEGVVTDLIFQKGFKGSNYAPVVKFSNAKGETQTLRCQYGNLQVFLPNVGDRVDVFYDPKDVSEFFINDFLNLWFVPLVFLVVFVGVGLIIRWILTRN
jgi:hypothetical protein